MALSELFQPLNELYFPDPPENLHKLYEISMVKIKDIDTIHLNQTAPNTLFSQSPNPNPSLFEVKKQTDGTQ